MNLTVPVVRALLALIVVAGSLLVCSALVVLPMVSGLQNAKDFISAAKDFGALFSGIIGTIVGYYFGQSSGR